MPYTNVPDDLQDKMESCVEKVTGQGREKEAAIAICYAAVVEGKAEAVEAVKAAGFVLDIPAEPMTLNLGDIPPDAIKALGDMELEVLGVPFGGPDNGKDSDGQYFSENTKTYLSPDKEIPVFYFHGFTPDKRPQAVPEHIGNAKYSRTDKRGHWFRVTLKKGLELARRVWEAAKKGVARASSGSISHLVRIARSGEILHWPVAEMSLFDAGEGRNPANAYAVALPVSKAHYAAAKMEMNISADEAEDPTNGQAAGEAATPGHVADESTQPPQGEITMDELETKVDAAVKAALAAQAAETAAKKAEEERIAAEVEARVKKETEAIKAAAAADRRLPGGDGAPYVAKFNDIARFDNLDAADTAVLIGVLNSQKSANSHPASKEAYKALVVKLSEDKGEVGEVGRKAIKAAGLDAAKANEIDYSTYASYGDEWVGIAYSQAIWDAIRLETFVLNKLPQVEVPQGMESIYLPLESTDPTWYKVAEATSSATAYSGPTPTVTASLYGTGRVQLTLAKLGARVVWTGELEEGSLIPFAGQLRSQMVKSGADYLESALIDGDTVTTASTNINDIDGTPTATDWFLVWDGFRKSCLGTTTANSRSASGSLDVTDYLETVKLMGTGGKNAIDTSKVGFIIDPSTYFKTLQLPEVLTRDVFVSPTLEGGRLTGLWGYQIGVSGSMCKNGGNGLSEATGKCDETTADNAYGQILAVRWDQWKFGWRRRMTMETTRFANSDSSEIVAMIRCGLIQRDTEASSITYYVGV